MVGGDLHWIWSPYSIYQDIDYVSVTVNFQLLTIIRKFNWHQIYGVKAFQDGDGFTNAQGRTSGTTYLFI
jgi:hypothetical protein